VLIWGDEPSAKPQPEVRAKDGLWVWCGSCEGTGWFEVDEDRNPVTCGWCAGDGGYYIPVKA